MKLGRYRLKDWNHDITNGHLNIFDGFPEHEYLGPATIEPPKVTLEHVNQRVKCGDTHTCPSRGVLKGIVEGEFKYVVHEENHYKPICFKYAELI